MDILVLQNLHKMGSSENHDQLRSKDDKEVDWLVSGLCFIARTLPGVYIPSAFEFFLLFTFSQLLVGLNYLIITDHLVEPLQRRHQQ